MSRKIERNKYADLLYSLYLLLIVCLCICSCTSENNIFDNNDSKLLNFSVSVPEWKNNDNSSDLNTRAMPVSGASFDKASSFNIIAETYDGTKNHSTIIENEAVSYTNNMWQTTSTHYWPGNANKTVNFYAYYPTGISSSITHTAGSAPTLSYTVPDDVASQIDIMTATGINVSGSTNSSTPLAFNHIFAAVKFAVGTNGLPSGTIKSITISGINNSGTYTFGRGWTLGSSTSAFTISPSTAITGAAGTNIASDTFTMMMIPQNFSNASLTLAYSNGTTFSTTISSTWNAGGLYTYNLSKTIIYNYDYTGVSQTFTAPYTGTYRIQCWGAQGGTLGTLDTGIGGTGGYTNGEIKLSKGTVLYVYVGQQGQTTSGGTISGGGWNGGGNGDTTGYVENGRTGGGGSTDIRVITGAWNDTKSLNSRIMVAGAGGGGGGNGLAGGAGGLSGYNGSISTAGKGGTQSAGGSGGSGSWGNATAGGLGYGGTGCSYASGGGSGYYGGGGGARDLYDGNGGGGSSYISGQSGCNTYSPTYIFSKTSISDSKTAIISPTGLTETGHIGNGYARITFVSAN
ncbi:fimbrillin family protein [Xylanibacter oryzae]|uniref:fimbrillin family protein n=1 Tax=Xylanibacter oryzae TaxID=185293 RepID=UPI0004B18780|nr:fimbrillin family protein [Xylanibacter oryzae]